MYHNVHHLVGKRNETNYVHFWPIWQCCMLPLITYMEAWSHEIGKEIVNQSLLLNPNLRETNKYWYRMVFWYLHWKPSIGRSGKMLLKSIDVTEWLTTRSWNYEESLKLAILLLTTFLAYSLGFKFDAINSYKINYSLLKQHKNGQFYTFRVGIHFDICNAMKLLHRFQIYTNNVELEIKCWDNRIRKWR